MHPTHILQIIATISSIQYVVSGKVSNNWWTQHALQSLKGCIVNVLRPCPLVGMTQMHVSFYSPWSQSINALARYAHTHARIFSFSRQWVCIRYICIVIQTQPEARLQLSCTRRNVTTPDNSSLRRTTMCHLHGTQRWHASFCEIPDCR